MTYSKNIGFITRSELDNLIAFFNKTIPMNFDNEGEGFGYYNVNKGIWEGQYEFIYQDKKSFVKGDFERISKEAYKGQLIIELNPELERIILENIGKIVPSIKKKIQNSKTESFSKNL